MAQGQIYFKVIHFRQGSSRENPHKKQRQNNLGEGRSAILQPNRPLSAGAVFAGHSSGVSKDGCIKIKTKK